MRDKEIISGRQLVLLVFTFIIATGTLFIPNIVTQVAKQDGWISILIGAIPALIVVLIVTSLGLKYPNKSLIEYSQIIIGKWPGKVIGIIYILFYIHLSSIIVREITSTIHETLLQNISLETITIIIFLACAYSVKMGLETITRANVLNLFITYIAIFTVFFLLIKDMNLEMLTPILSEGISPVLKSSVSPAGWFCEVVSIAFIIPFLNKPKEARAASLLGVTWVAVTLSFMTILVLSIFGPQLTASLSFPTLEAVRYINVGEYIQRVEIIFLIPWIVSNYLKICFFYYISVLIVSKFFKIEKTKTMVIPIGIIIFSFSILLFANNVDLSAFLSLSWGWYSLPIELGIPAILFSIALFRKKGQIKSDKGN